MFNSERTNASYDPDTVRILREALDDAWKTLPSEQQMHTEKSALALAILRLASNGERDSTRLSTLALDTLMADGSASQEQLQQRER
jgi:hypothetical protein